MTEDEARDSGLSDTQIQALRGPVFVFEHKDAAALAGAFKHMGIKIRYDLRSQVAQFRSKRATKWEAFNDRNTAAIREQIAVQYQYLTTKGPSRLRYGDAAWTQSLDSLLFKCELDPFVEYLESLPPWDGVERCRFQLATAFGAEGELAEWASLYVFLGAVQRAYSPGCKLDEIPVLIGEQGIGKSAFLRACLPDDASGWFADGLHLADKPKERAEALLGRVIVEAAEMAGSTRADLESLKAFLTRQDDGSVRLSYRRNPEVMLRRCIIVGTSNTDDCLPNDPTGNRRFVPISCLYGINQEENMARERAQCWVEALAEYRLGKRANLPRGVLQDQAAVAAENARRRDVILEDAITVAVARGASTLPELAVATGLARAGEAAALDMRLQRRLGAALAAQGWTKARETVDGRQCYVWHPPGPLELPLV